MFYMENIFCKQSMKTKRLKDIKFSENNKHFITNIFFNYICIFKYLVNFNVMKLSFNDQHNFSICKFLEAQD